MFRALVDVDKAEMDFSIYEKDVVERHIRIPMLKKLYERKLENLRPFQNGKNIWMSRFVRHYFSGGKIRRSLVKNYCFNILMYFSRSASGILRASNACSADQPTVSIRLLRLARVAISAPSFFPAAKFSFAICRKCSS